MLDRKIESDVLREERDQSWEGKRSSSTKEKKDKDRVDGGLWSFWRRTKL